MTLQELSKYYKLHERLERNREMLSSLYAAAGPGAQIITGMPHAPGVSDKVGDLAAELWDLQSKIEYLEQRCAEEKKKLEKYIGDIKDDQTRMIFRLRFIHCIDLAPGGRGHRRPEHGEQRQGHMLPTSEKL